MPRRYNKKRNVRKGRKGGYASRRTDYRQGIPRTIQIATKRNMNQTLKFVVNQTWVCDPNQLQNGQAAVLSYRANSIFHSHMPTDSTAALVFKSQDPAKYNNDGQLQPAVIQQNADGWDEWTNRYQHFCVTGSKISYSCEPTGTGCPYTMFSHLSGVSGAVTKASKSSFLNELPFTKRHSMPSSSVTYTTGGIRGSLTYSARKFEGVKDPEDNGNLRGRFANPNLQTPTDGATPGEQSFFYIAMAPVDPLTQTKMPSSVVRVKIEYIVQLKEPTETNQIQVVTSTANVPDEL